ncbi:MAG: DUF58 domain-containing protein [Candidatus Bathyarchaeia archaeon]
MRIPKTSIQTSWRADWLVEFSIALIVLAFLAREIIFAAVGAGILLSLASLSLLFHRRLGVLRRELHIAERLPKTGVCLGDSIEGDLTIRNGSRLAAQIVAVTPVVEKGLSFKLSSSSNQSLRPGTTSSSKFEIASLKSGRFRISGFTLAFTDSRGLFTSEVNYEQADWVEVYPSVRTKVPITPLRLYGGGPEIFRKGPAGMDYAGVRQYVPGDEYHRVEWKATARLRTLMVKEFHPETQTTLQILIDTGRTMRQQSYVGAKFDEALAVAQLLVQLGKRADIWIYNESEIVQTIKPANTEEQLASLRELALAGRVLSKSEEPASRVPAHPALRRETSKLFGGDRFVMFLRLLKLKLGLSHRKAGLYKATMEATRASPDGLLIVLTDLEGDNEALLEVASSRQKRGKTIVAQIGSGWRLSDDLEEAYVKHQVNSRILSNLEQLGLMAFDLRPEELIDRIAHGVGKGSIEAH